MSTLERQIAEIVGADHVSSGENLPLSPTPPLPLSPSLTVAPASVEELSACMAACHAARVAVVPCGGGTRQSWGRPPAAERFVVVRTTRLDRTLVYEPDDLTISVEAGMTLQALDTALAANGQMLPLDAPLPARSTIGGILAAGADGPRRLGYGTARDLLIGVRVVEATGRVSKAGGMVVKNVSGFDMMKLYLGSLGTLAIIVSANFKLMPRPRAAASVVAACPSPEAAFALAEAIFGSQLTPVAVEYLEGWDGAGLAPAAPAHLAVRAEGLPAAVERHVRDVTALADGAGARPVTLRHEEHGALWDTLNDLPQTAEAAPDELALRLSCLPGDLARAIGDARERAGSDLELAVCARALSGVAYLRARGPAAGLRAFYTGLLGAWPQTAAIAAPAALADLPAWGAPPQNLELMRRIKAEFDPEGLLNPGRYVV